MKFLKISAQWIIQLIVAIAQAVLPFIKKNDDKSKKIN